MSSEEGSREVQSSVFKKFKSAAGNALRATAATAALVSAGGIGPATAEGNPNQTQPPVKDGQVAPRASRSEMTHRLFVPGITQQEAEVVPETPQLKYLLEGKDIKSPEEYGKLVVDLIETQEEFDKTWESLKGDSEEALAEKPEYNPDNEIAFFAAVNPEGGPNLKFNGVSVNEGNYTFSLIYNSPSIGTYNPEEAGFHEYAIGIIPNGESSSGSNENPAIITVSYPDATEPFRQFPLTTPTE